MNNALIIFIKNAEAGKVKTRLALTIGIDKAFEVYKILTAHTHAVSKNVHADKFVFYSSFINDDDEWVDEYFTKRIQKGDDLGERMFDAFDVMFADAYENVCIIGSDCPEITTALIDKAFEALRNANVVIGPAKDGGYYLLGLRKIQPELFRNISWSTIHVLIETLAVCKRLNLSVFLLPVLSDVDVESDLEILHKIYPLTK